MIANNTVMPMSIPMSMPMPMPMPMANPMEVMEDIEPREIEPGVPERVGDPSIHVRIIPGRRIVGHDGRAFGGIIIIDC
jgi:hypothetical protein